MLSCEAKFKALVMFSKHFGNDENVDGVRVRVRQCSPPSLPNGPNGGCKARDKHPLHRRTNANANANEIEMPAEEHRFRRVHRIE